MRVQSLIAVASLLTGIRAVPLSSPSALRTREDLGLDDQNNQYTVPEPNDSGGARGLNNEKSDASGYLQANVPTDILNSAEGVTVENPQDGQIINPESSNKNVNSPGSSEYLEASAAVDFFDKIDPVLNSPKPRRPPRGFHCAKDDTCPLLDISKNQVYLCKNDECIPGTLYFDTQEKIYIICIYIEKKDPKNCVSLQKGALPPPPETDVAPKPKTQRKRSINQFQAEAHSSSSALHARDFSSDSELDRIPEAVAYAPRKDSTFNTDEYSPQRSGYLTAYDYPLPQPIGDELKRAIFEYLRQNIKKLPYVLPSKDDSPVLPKQQPPESVPQQRPTIPPNTPTPQKVPSGPAG